MNTEFVAALEQLNSELGIPLEEALAPPEAGLEPKPSIVTLTLP